MPIGDQPGTPATFRTGDEEPLRLLAGVWILLFGSGAALSTIAMFFGPFSVWRSGEPLLWAVPAGQVLLFVASVALRRDPRGSVPGAAALCAYKVVAGLGMLSGLLLPGGTEGASLLVAAGGGAMDLGMGGLTWMLWRRARRGIASAGRRGGLAETDQGRPLRAGLPALLLVAAAVVAAAGAWLGARLVSGHPSAPVSRVAVANLAGTCAGLSAAAAAVAFARRGLGARTTGSLFRSRGR